MNHDEVIRSVVCLLALDGKLNKEEMRFLQKMRQRLGVSSEVLNDALKQAKQGKGRISLSPDTDEMKRLLDILVSAAVIDGKIAPQERRALNALAAKAGLPPEKMELMLAIRMKQASKSKIPPPPRPEDATPTRQAPRVGLSGEISQNRRVCPKCGYEQEMSQESCRRCGIIFQKHELRDHEETEAQAFVPEYEEDRDSAQARLERFKRQSYLIKQWIGMGVTTLVFIGLAFWMGYAFEGAAKVLLLLLLFVVFAGVLGVFFALNYMGEVTTGYMLRKRSYRHRQRHGGYSESYYVTYEFDVPQRSGEPKTYQSESSVEKFHYRRLGEGAPLKVRYLRIWPKISRIELW